MEFVISSDVRLKIQVPSEICYPAGNGYKAVCWVVAHCKEVENISVEAMES